MRRFSKVRARDRRRRKEVRERVFERDGGCLAARSSLLIDRWGRCFGELTPHHLCKSGPYDETNLVALCAFHNSMVEDDPDYAHAAGLVIKSWERDGAST